MPVRLALEFYFITDIRDNQSSFAELNRTGLVIVIMVDIDRRSEYILHLEREHTTALAVVDAVIHGKVGVGKGAELLAKSSTFIVYHAFLG